MKMTVKLLSLAASLAVLLATACGGKQGVASKSNAAYQEAQKKGLPVGEAVHGGHAAAEDAPMAGMDHSKMDQGDMTGMEHPKRQGSMVGMDHSRIQAGAKAGSMDHSKMEPGSMGGMDHPKMDQGGMAGMDHSKMEQHAMGDPLTAAIVTDKSAEPMRGESATTLMSDPLDAPATTALVDAERSAEMAQMMTSGGHGMSHGSYVHQDAGRDRVVPEQPMDHSGHDAEKQQIKQDSPPRTDMTNQNATYSCPMHPEVQSSTPGRCPKCGMTLVKKDNR